MLVILFTWSFFREGSGKEDGKERRWGRWDGSIPTSYMLLKPLAVRGRHKESTVNVASRYMPEAVSSMNETLKAGRSWGSEIRNKGLLRLECKIFTMLPASTLSLLYAPGFRGTRRIHHRTRCVSDQSGWAGSRVSSSVLFGM